MWLYRERVETSIRFHRTRLKLSQIELAAKVGCDRGHLSKVERDASFASMKLILKLAEVLEVAPLELLLPPESRSDDLEELRNIYLKLHGQQRAFALQMLRGLGSRPARG